MACAKPVGFPLPFQLVFGIPVWFPTLISCFLGFFGQVLWRDRALLKEVVTTVVVMHCQILLTVVYPVYFYGYTSLRPLGQKYYVILLPFIKILAKNLISAALGTRYDLLPQIMIFNVDVFNALYVSNSMQSSNSITTTLLMVLIDIIQALISISDISHLITPVNQLRHKLPRDHPLKSACFVEIALQIIKENPKVQTQLSRRRYTTALGVLTSQHARRGSIILASATTLAESAAKQIRSWRKTSSARVLANLDSPRVDNFPSPRPEVLQSFIIPDAALSPKERQLFVERTARVLFTTEFVILVEYTEVIVPIIYCMYTAAMFYLPNRAYYPLLKELDEAGLRTKIGDVLTYAMVELLSLLVIGYIIQQKLRISMLQLLSFVLDKSWRMVQSNLLLWIFFTVESSIQHSASRLAGYKEVKRLHIDTLKEIFYKAMDKVDRGEDEPPLQFASEKEYKTHFHKVQEALLLLAAVHHVDHTAFRLLLSQYCNVNFGLEGEEKFEEEIPARFVLHIDLEQVKTQDGTFDSDLVQFCTLKHPSDEFLTALRKIAELDENLMLTEAGVEVQVPVRVYLSERFHRPMTALATTYKAEKVMRENWKQCENNAICGPLQPIFVVEPMVADLEGVPIRAEMAEMMETLVRDNIWFSRLVLNTDLDVDILSTDVDTWKITFGKLMTSVFDTTRRDPKIGHFEYSLPETDPPRSQIHAVQVCFEGWEGAFPAFAPMFSAIAVNQAVSKLTLDLSINPNNETASAHAWKWLAYTLFSKRARESSALQSLCITATASCSISQADIEAFRSVVFSDHPEEELFGYPCGSVASRGATLEKGNSVRWYFDDVARPTDFRLLPLDSPVRFVRTFSDDGRSDWVNVVIPGYGRCQARRADLNFVEKITAYSVPPTLTSLQLPFYNSDAHFMCGLPLLISTVGPMLKFLALDGVDPNASKSLFLESCPRLEGLSRCSRGVEACLDFKGYHSSGQQLPALSYDCTDVVAFLQALTDATNPLQHCIRRLRVKLNDIFNWRGEDAVDDTVEALLDVLVSNETIEYFDVVAPPQFHVLAAGFRAFNLKPLPRPLQPLSIECKVAFMSVMGLTRPTFKRERKSVESRKPLCQLNEHVLSKIFAFAAPPMIRKVYFRKAHEDDWEDDDAEVPL
ncbi:hypothetical protein ON010_g8481 [Phytophthora cinnamomi]|nr:hypothetical protein ON010_g8481 [Phytophthora cinnamomi]